MKAFVINTNRRFIGQATNFDVVAEVTIPTDGHCPETSFYISDAKRPDFNQAFDGEFLNEWDNETLEYVWGRTQNESKYLISNMREGKKVKNTHVGARSTREGDFIVLLTEQLTGVDGHSENEEGEYALFKVSERKEFSRINAGFTLIKTAKNEFKTESGFLGYISRFMIDREKGICDHCGSENL